MVMPVMPLLLVACDALVTASKDATSPPHQPCSPSPLVGRGRQRSIDRATGVAGIAEGIDTVAANELDGTVQEVSIPRKGWWSSFWGLAVGVLCRWVGGLVVLFLFCLLLLDERKAP